MTRLTPALALALGLSLAACQRTAPSKTAAASPPAPKATTHPARRAAGTPAAGTSIANADGGTTADAGAATGPTQPPYAYTQHEPIKPCSPHVDGSDADHRLSLVETAAHESATGGRATLELLGLDAPGACAFAKRKPASFRGFEVDITAPGSSVPIGHYLVGHHGKSTTALAFVFTGPKGHKHVRKILTGFVDLIKAEPRQVEIGFDVHDATGASYGCFTAPVCGK